MGQSYGRKIAALAGALMVGITILSVSPASAAPPFPDGAQATPLVGSTIVARCPVGSPGAVAGGTATIGAVTVGSPAGAQCFVNSATADGEYIIAGVTPVTNPPSEFRFSAKCESTTGFTSGGVDVPTGTTVPGLGVVTKTTLVTAPNTEVVYPGGTTAILNEVITTDTSVTRNAIRIKSGTGAGSVIGRVICGAANVYPLAVDVSGAAGPALAAQSAPAAGGGMSTTTLLAGGAIALAVLTQIAFVWRRRDDATS